MAPKRARRSQGPSTQAPTSSDSSSMGEVEFTSDGARTEFQRLMNKSIVKERGFLPTAEDGELLNMIQERGWESFCEAPEAVPLAIIREFYANAKENRDGFTVVRGIRVDYSAEAIRRVIGGRAKRRNEEDWVVERIGRAKRRFDDDPVDLERLVYDMCVPDTTWKMTAPPLPAHVSFPAAALNRYAKAWNAFICANIMPSSHGHEVTVDRAILLFGIVSGKYIDLGHVIHQGILRFLQGGTTGAIPYGTIVTKLCRASGVRWPANEQLQLPAAPIDHSAISRMTEWDGGVPHPRGLGYIYDEMPGGRPGFIRRERTRASGAGTSQTERSSEPMGDVHYRRLARRMDTMHDIHQRFAFDLTQALGSAFQAQGVTVQWPVFGAGMQYPPPDSPPAEEGEDSDSE
uniref:Putative plant transposon protein domain-containing protein n=1 Tax=Daucus carota subsp. sativus TaxID=79200 RepID=A0A164YA28_DAUCS